MRTVELLFDAALDAAVRAVWARLDASGLASLAAHPHPTNRPHVTLAAGPTLPELDLPLPIPVTLDGLVLFDGRAGVLAWRVVPSPELLRLQETVWRAMADENPLRAPAAWTPHVSLAKRVRQAPGPPPAAHGFFVAARSYDTGSRTVTQLS